MVPTDAQTVLLSTTAVKSLLQNGNDIDRSSQVLLSGLLNGMTSSLSDLVATENTQEQKAVADEVLITVVSLMEVKRNTFFFNRSPSLTINFDTIQVP